METKEMTPEQSLQVISDAIAKSRRDFEKNSGTPMIIWGAVVIAFSFAVWYLTKSTENVLWNFLWFGVPVVGVALTSLLLKDRCRENTGNFISRSIGQIWIVYGVFATVLSAAFSIMAAHQYIGYITAVLLGFAAVMTGIFLKNRFVTAGGFITGIGCTIALFLVQQADSTLFFAAAAVLNLLVPGIMMNRKAN